MHSYRSLKMKHGTRVSQTIDSPILIFDFWELSEGFAALLIFLIFGVIFYSWGLMALLLVLCLGIAPVIRSKNPKGIFLHRPYRKFGMELPGLINPKGDSARYSD